MAARPDDLRTGDAGTEIEPKPEAIHAEMEQTRAALTEKLESLEHKVMGTVESVQHAVMDTIQSVKEGVSDTVDAVKRAFDLNLQIQKRPWLMLGSSVAVGFAAGWLIGGRQSPRRQARRMTAAMSEELRNGQPAIREPEAPGWFTGLRHQFRDEIEVLQRAGIGALMGVVRDFAKRTLPAIAPQLDQAMNSATSKLGGEPIRRPILHPEASPAVPGTPPASDFGEL